MSSGPETPPDSGFRANNVLNSFRKAEHVVPIPFLVQLNCSVTIVAAQSLQLGAVSDNFQLKLQHVDIFSQFFSQQLFLFCCTLPLFEVRISGIPEFKSVSSEKKPRQLDIKQHEEKAMISIMEHLEIQKEAITSATRMGNSDLIR